MDEQKMLLHGLWRKAWKATEPILVPCRTKSNAIKLRFALYNSVRFVRAGKENADETLREAAENVSIGTLEGDPTTLVLQRRTLSETMKTIAAILADEGAGPGAEVGAGGSAFGPTFELPAEAKTGEQLLAEASQERLKRLLSEQEGEPAASRVTPYYTR
jgi:hypothetical protein